MSVSKRYRVQPKLASRSLHVFVEVPITISSKTHCSNDCRFMALASEGECILDGDGEPAELVWDRRKHAHGYKRTRACRNAETRRKCPPPTSG